MIIKKKDYEELWSMISKQNEQIEELIKLVLEANARTNHATKCFFDLVEFVDIRFNILPPEAKKDSRRNEQSLTG